MSASILVTSATRYGSTQEVAEAIAATLREAGLEIDIQPVKKVRALEKYRAVVLGAPLYIGRWHKEAHRFLSQNQAALTQQPVAIFALGPLQDAEKQWRDVRAQLDKELAKYPWLTLVDLEMFGGKYDPGKLRFPIKWLAGKEPVSDLRDWTAVRTWASNLAAKFEPALSLSG